VFVSLVILTYRRPEAILRLLGQLSLLQDPHHEVIVVENAGGDDTADRIAERFPAVRLIRCTTNTGVGARNRGLEIARGEVLVCLDDDMLDFDDADLAHLRTRFAAAPRLGGLCFKVVWPGTDRVRDWVHRRPIEHADRPFETYEITEGAVAWRHAALREVGYYREDFFISHEGLELAYRVLGGGWTIEYDHAVAVGHAHDDGGRASWRRYYYDTRNLFWIAALHQPFGYAWHYLGLGVAAMFVYSLRDGHLGAWLRAVRDGVAGMRRFRRERSVWSPATRSYIEKADAWRPGFWSLVRKRLRQKEFSLD
jgi:hypothetical protein